MKYDIESIKKRKENSRVIRRVANIILVIIVYNIVLLTISYINKITNVNIFGYKAYIITTNSMEPKIKVGDIVIAKTVKEEELKEGDVITFWQDQEVITHRIVRIEERKDNNYYITKGDNNNVEDPKKVAYEQVEGKSIFTIPYLGKFVGILENRIIFLIILLVLFILCFLKIQREEKRDSRREKKKIEEEKKLEN